MMNPSDIPTISIYKNEKRTARKQHLCCVCKGPINKGQVYQRVFSVEDGFAVAAKFHPDYKCLRGDDLTQTA